MKKYPFKVTTADLEAAIEATGSSRENLNSYSDAYIDGRRCPLAQAMSRQYPERVFHEVWRADIMNIEGKRIAKLDEAFGSIEFDKLVNGTEFQTEITFL